MPWVEKEDCIGCELCVEICPVDVIYIEGEKAEIDLKGCIRCGECHGVCPQNAVRHDSEKISEEVVENINWVRGLMGYYDTVEEKEGFLYRINKHFKKEKEVVKKTLEELESFKIN